MLINASPGWQNDTPGYILINGVDQTAKVTQVDNTAHAVTFDVPASGFLEKIEFKSSNASGSYAIRIFSVEVDGLILLDNSTFVNLTFASPNPDLQYFQVGDSIDSGVPWTLEQILYYAGSSSNGKGYMNCLTVDGVVINKPEWTSLCTVTGSSSSNAKFLNGNCGDIWSVDNSSRPMPSYTIDFTSLQAEEKLKVYNTVSVAAFQSSTSANKCTVEFVFTDHTGAERRAGYSPSVDASTTVDFIPQSLLDQMPKTVKITAVDTTANTMTVDGGVWEGSDGSGDVGGETVVTGPAKSGVATFVSTNGTDTMSVENSNNQWIDNTNRLGEEFFIKKIFTALNANDPAHVEMQKTVNEAFDAFPKNVQARKTQIAKSFTKLVAGAAITKAELNALRKVMTAWTDEEV